MLYNYNEIIFGKQTIYYLPKSRLLKKNQNSKIQFKVYYDMLDSSLLQNCLSNNNITDCNNYYKFCVLYI